MTGQDHVPAVSRAPDGDGLVRVRVPGDKSISHRAIILAAVAEGTSRLAGLLPAADPRATAEVLRTLGADVPELPQDGSALTISGRGLGGLSEPRRVLDCANSGTTARLLMGLLAAHSFSSVLDGDTSLRSRPMRRVTEPLARMGATFEELGRADRLPIRVTGGELRGIVHESPRASAQIKSSVLLAGLAGRVVAEVVEPIQSRDHTERLLGAMGARLERDIAGDRPRVILWPADRLEPLELDVPADFSSAAFVIALGLLLPAGGGRSYGTRLLGVGVNPTRTGLLRVLERMGADIEVLERREVGGEPSADLIVRPAELTATTVEPVEVPALIDEIPVLSILAAMARGETRITGADELRVKETDRLAGLAENLRAVGVEAEELPDGLVIVGSDLPLAGSVRTHGDHRIAMAFGILGALPGSRIRVDDHRAVEVSYPRFWDDLGDLGAALGYPEAAGGGMRA